MRVLVCIPCLLTGGTEVQTLSLVEALVSLGHTVATVCYFESTPEMAARYRAAGSEVYCLSAPGSGRPVGVAKTLRHLWGGLKRTVREFKPDAAHVQYMAPGAIPILILRALGVRRVLATTHTAADIYSPRGLQVIRFLTNRVLSGFQCITHRAEESYFGPEKSPRHFTIYNSLPSHIGIADRPRRGNPVTVGVVSRLEHIKGMDMVVPAFRQLLAAHPEARLIVAGDGSMRARMEREAEGLANVEFLGRVQGEDLTAVYDRIDVLLMPSRSEGFGLTAIEGMARGCVPVVADTGGLPEVVTDGSTGLIHKPENVDDLARQIIHVFDDGEKFRALSAAALERAALFTPAQYRLRIKEWLDKLGVTS